jgi:hemoglobin
MKFCSRAAANIVLPVLVFAGCGASQKPVVELAPPPAVVEPASAIAPPPLAPPAPKLLFERLGGKEGIAFVVDEFLKNVAADTRVSKIFAKTKGDRLDKLKASLGDQICEVSGGPCKYAGKEMKAAHKGMGVTEVQWDAFIEDLSLALQARGLGEEEKSELFAAIGKYRDDIVEKRPAKK